MFQLKDNSQPGIQLSVLRSGDVFRAASKPQMLLSENPDEFGYLPVFDLVNRVQDRIHAYTLVIPLTAEIRIVGERIANPVSVEVRSAQLSESEIARLREPAPLIPVIKMVRQRLGLGLRDAKELVESEATRLGISLE